MSASKLDKPSLIYKDSFLEALQEFHAEGRFLNVQQEQTRENFNGFLKKMSNRAGPMHKPFDDWVEPVPEFELWLVKNHDYIGSVQIRHRLNWHLEKWGGHVNFFIRPSMRNKGFGKKILQKAIPYILHVGIERALLTCAPDNISAQKVIDFSGGVYHDTLPQTDKFPTRARYWLSTL